MALTIGAPLLPLAAAEVPIPREAVAWVRDRLPECENTEEVARSVFGELGWQEASKYVDRSSLPDGSTALIVVPNHGAGNCHNVDEYHFELWDGSCELRFVSDGPRASYLVEEPKLNGRYQIEQFECQATGGRLDSWIETRWFWSDGAYLPAFVTRSEEPDRPVWVEENRAAYEAVDPAPPD